MTITTTTEQPDRRNGPAGPSRTAVGLIAVIAIVVAAVVAFAVSRPARADGLRATTIEFDVAEDGTRFVWDEAPVFDDGWPAYGNAFVTQGYLYPAGAIEDGAGVNADGSPTHPELVVGTWTCEGHFLGDGARTETGAWVVSKQIFDLGDRPGDETIVTDGVELVDHEVEGRRAIVGGTGEYRAATGEAVQVLHGHNDSEGVQLTVTLDVVRPASAD